MAEKHEPLDIRFTAVLGKVREGDTWTCVQLDLAASVRRAIGKVDGDEVEVHLTERLS